MLTTCFLLACAFFQADGYLFEPPSKAFRVELPSPPDSTADRTLNSKSGPLRVTTAEARMTQATYSVQVVDNPARVDPNTLDDGIRRFAATKHATLGAVTAIDVGGNPGREFDLTETVGGSTSRSKQRWVAAGNSLVMIAMNGKPGAEIPASSARFLNSLSFGPVQVAAAAMPAGPENVEVTIEEPAAEDEAPPATPEPEKKANSKVSSKKFTISRLPKGATPYPDETLEDLPRSFAGDGFRDIGPKDSILVGLRVSFTEMFGGPKISSVQPIYRSGTKHYVGRVYGPVNGPVATVFAKPGYSVGGLITHSGLMVDGFQVVYMKVNGDRLDFDDQYTSPWLGDPNGGGPGEVATNGGVVVGLQGTADNKLLAIGLTALK